MSDSKRLTSLFESPTKSGGTYFSGSPREDITIPAGSRISLVKSSKVASNGSPIWSLLVDPPGARDENRIYDSRRDIDPADMRNRQHDQRFDDDTIPF